MSLHSSSDLSDSQLTTEGIGKFCHLIIQARSVSPTEGKRVRRDNLYHFNARAIATLILKECIGVGFIYVSISRLRMITTITCCIGLFVGEEHMIARKLSSHEKDQYGWHSGTRTLSKVGKHLTYILLGTSSMTSALTAYQQNNLSLFHYITSCKCYY
uniref:Uncharacterized protein n=1 Tax=Glossina palpalis gambiensis TaxID=67801 RepID=A0A1B0BHJ3_9MUSC